MFISMLKALVKTNMVQRGGVAVKERPLSFVQDKTIQYKVSTQR